MNYVFVNNINNTMLIILIKLFFIKKDLLMNSYMQEFKKNIYDIQTEYEGQVKKFMEVLEKKDTDGIIAAGGGGTLLEVCVTTSRETRFDKGR